MTCDCRQYDDCYGASYCKKAIPRMSGAHLYNRIDLDDGLMVTIKPVTVKSGTGYLLVLTDLDSRMECGRRIFPTFAAAHAYAESCFLTTEETE